MGWRNIKLALDHSRAKGADLLVLIIVAEIQNDANGEPAWPGIETIASRARVSVRQAWASIRRLAATGELLVDRGGGRHRTNNYRIAFSENYSLNNLQSKGEQSSVFSKETVKSNAQNSEVSSPEPEGTRNMGEPEKNQKSSRAAAVVPESLLTFNSILREAGPTTYRPTATFFEKVLGKYASLDLEEEAIKIVSWLEGERGTKKGRACSTGFVLSWLKKSLKEASSDDYRSGRRNGREATGSSKPSTDSPFAKYSR